jgi:hypothetical protein
LVAFVVAWNAAALVLGIVGAFRRESRRKLARLANWQAATAAGISVAALIFGGVIRLAGILLFGQAFGAFPNIFVAFGAAFWAFGGIFPFTIAVFLLAERRDAPDTRSEQDRRG